VRHGRPMPWPSSAARKADVHFFSAHAKLRSRRTHDYAVLPPVVHLK